MEVVWHGNYLHYFEEAREAFGRKYGIGYTDVKGQAHQVPVVHSEVAYKRPLRYGDEMRVEVRFENSPAAKIIFHYSIFRLEDNALMATGKTIQVFTDFSGELQLVLPPFFEQWKAKWL